MQCTPWPRKKLTLLLLLFVLFGWARQGKAMQGKGKVERIKISLRASQKERKKERKRSREKILLSKQKFSPPPHNSSSSRTTGSIFIRGLFFLWQFCTQYCTCNPTNNALLINLLLSSDAEIFVSNPRLSVQVEAKPCTQRVRVPTVLTFLHANAAGWVCLSSPPCGGRGGGGGGRHAVTAILP